MSTPGLIAVTMYAYFCWLDASSSFRLTAQALVFWMKKAAVVGAGLAGRLLALQLAKWNVTVFDSGTKSGKQSCGAIAAGMLAPLAELETAEPIIYELGMRSISLWPQILEMLAAPTFYKMAGSIVVAHSKDAAELHRFYSIITKKMPETAKIIQRLSGSELSVFEPELKFNNAFYLPTEGQIDCQQLFHNLELTLTHRTNLIWYENVTVDKVIPHKITIGGIDQKFDMVFDCRGLGAKQDLSGLRGVRGEIITLYAPSVHINRPIRLMHPRYKVYIVPRPDGCLMVGATEIESTDFSPISVQSIMELLSASYVVHRGVAEARILSTSTNCRPAFADNLPYIHHEPGLIQINGLYRHGYLIAPALIENAISGLS